MKRLIGILRVAAGLVVLTLAVLLSAYFAMHARFNPSAPAHDPSPATSPLAAQRQDLAYFRRLIALDGAFSPAARREADVRTAALLAAPRPLDGPRLRMALAGIVALADNAHSQIGSAPGGRATQVPLRLYGFSDGLYVVRAQAALADLLGAQVVAVEGRPVGAVLDALNAYRGGAPAWRRNWARIVLTSPELLYGAELAADPGQERLLLRLPDGRMTERTIRATRPGDDEPSPTPTRWLAPAAAPKEPPGWRPLLSPQARLPLALRDGARVFRVAWVDDGCIIFLQMKANQDEDGQSIAAFQAQVRAALRARPACGAIVDLRFNGGGDYTLAAGLAHDLPRLVKGRIVLLTGVDTFSAGITTAGFIKQAGGTRVTIVGQPVGDRLDFWSEGEQGCLPHAKLCVHYATGRHRYDGPCDDWRTCYWLNWLFPVRVRSLDPDIPVSPSFADYVALRDPAFERAMAVASGPVRAGP